MIRGEREIALTTPVSLTAFQPSLWDGSSLLPFQARELSGLATITGPYGTKSDGLLGYSVSPFHGGILFGHFMATRGPSRRLFPCSAFTTRKDSSSPNS
jgi:hypothetical protein